MKRIIFIVVLCLSQLSGYSQMTDALKDIWPVTDSKMKQSLNGEWRLKVVKGLTDEKSVPAIDDSWGTIPVPGCWEAYGFCTPQYSFPDSLTGYYRTTFEIPKAWKGQRVIIRLDGVLRGYDLWLNNQYVGSWEQSYNTCQFDLTPYLRSKGAQELSMRVYSRFKGYEFDCFDDWAPMGIFRDVTIFCIPTTHLSDLHVTTKMDGSVNVETKVSNSSPHTRVNMSIVDKEGKEVLKSTGMKMDGKIHSPHLWTAETPYLYTLTVSISERGKTLQTFRQKIGIRELRIEQGNVITLNGHPIKLRGVTCHSTAPWTVKVIADTLTLKDMRLMKEASVNYIRTSHYPREPRFFDLADSLGFYVICEAPFGSRGEKHLSKPDYYDILQSRVTSTIAIHKNHPSILIWSLGNENPLPKSCERLGEYAQMLDPSRPYCFPQKGSTFRSIGFERFPKQVPIYAPHYPTTSQIQDYYSKTDRPVIFTEYCHTLGISFEDHDRQWEIIEQTPGIAGGSVWEWADQGMPFRRRMGSRWRSDGGEQDQSVFTSDSSGFEMKGNFGTDGLLYADRTPLPNYYELQHNYARAFVRLNNYSNDIADLSVVNRFDFLNLQDNVRFHWVLTNDLDTVGNGTFSPDCPPHSVVPYQIHIPRQNGLSILSIQADDPDRHTFLHQSFVLNKTAFQLRGNTRPTRFIQEGPFVRTGRKATMAERITQKGRLISKYLLPLENKQVAANMTSSSIENGEDIAFTLSPDTADVFRAELGIGYLLDSSIDRVSWIGYGPYPSYPGRSRANRYGTWSKHKDDLYFEGNHSGIDAALFSDRSGNGILISGDSLSLNFEQTDLGIVVTVNAAVSGQGPKFAKTHFPGWQRGDDAVSGRFQLFGVDGQDRPLELKRLLVDSDKVEKPFRPFLTQYDTYLLRFEDIYDKE